MFVSKPEYDQEDEAHEIIWDFEIKADHLIQVRKLDQLLITIKEYLSSSWLVVFFDISAFVGYLMPNSVIYI